MSGWHRDHPELVGTEADPWMIHKAYADRVENLCVECLRPTRHRLGDEFVCPRCWNRDGDPSSED